MCLFQYHSLKKVISQKMCQTLKLGTKAVKPRVHCSIRDVINLSLFWSIDALERISQLQSKRRLHSR